MLILRVIIYFFFVCRGLFSFSSSILVMTIMLCFTFLGLLSIFLIPRLVFDCYEVVCLIYIYMGTELRCSLHLLTYIFQPWTARGS